MKGKLAVVLAGTAILLILGGVGGMYYFTGTPMYSLYLVRNAVQEKDSEVFFHYFDVRQVAKNVLARKSGGNRTSPYGTDALIKASEPAIKERVNKKLSDPDSIPLVKMSFDSVQYEDQTAKVTLRNPSDDSTTVVTMEQMPDRRWKIIDLDLSKAGVEFSREDAEKEAGKQLEKKLPIPQPGLPHPKLPIELP